VRAHPVYGTNGGGREETDGNVYALPACLREENKKKAFVGGCASERS